VALTGRDGGQVVAGVAVRTTPHAGRGSWTGGGVGA